MRALKFALALLLTILLQSCNEQPGWHASDVTGMMPDLEFSLTGPDGEAVDANSLRGKPVLVFFGFTNCPHICPTTLTQLPPYHVWASMVGQNGDKIPPFSMRIKPPLEASEEQIKEALRARANYSTPFKVASAAGMKSLTYIRDSFGLVLSEGAGSSPAPVVDIGTRASRSGNKTFQSLLNDLPLAGDALVEDSDDPDEKRFRDLEGDAATLFAEDDFS